MAELEPNDITLEKKGIFNGTVAKNAELDVLIKSENALRIFEIK